MTETDNIMREISKLENDAAELKDKIERFENQKKEKEGYIKRKSPVIRHNALIVRYVSGLMARGIHENEACVICAGKMKMEPYIIYDIFNQFYQMDKFIERRAVYMMAAKLHENHVPAKKIAEYCGFSEKYLWKVLKKVVENGRD